MDLDAWDYSLFVEILDFAYGQKARPSYTLYRHFQKKVPWSSQCVTLLSLFALESSLVDMILCTRSVAIIFSFG